MESEWCNCHFKIFWLPTSGHDTIIHCSRAPRATNHNKEHWITGRHLITHVMCTALVGYHEATTIFITWTSTDHCFSGVTNFYVFNCHNNIIPVFAHKHICTQYLFSAFTPEWSRPPKQSTADNWRRWLTYYIMNTLPIPGLSVSKQQRGIKALTTTRHYQPLASSFLLTNRLPMEETSLQALWRQ